ncbi:hypothetical protein RRG08_042166 [Elysia crispata]|uniref:Uncharacterized protein n=1 Tax=Elysia crispata TaxID=231223 RepID=A0AAE0Z7A1_9GAST|nr:hypothetical protein RRG08_042166 [Elysia crispata]
MTTTILQRSISYVYNDTKPCVPAPLDTSTDAEAYVPVIKKSQLRPKFFWWPSKVQFLLCKPFSKVTEALAVIRNSVGINNASTVSVQAGVIPVTTTSFKTFRKIATGFEGPDWAVTPHDCYQDKCKASHFEVHNYPFDLDGCTGFMSSLRRAWTR